MTTPNKYDVAPCGHPGVRVIGSYVQCPRCDALPDRNEIDASKYVLCPNCRTLDVAKTSDDRWWRCNQCALKFQPTKGNQP